VKPSSTVSSFLAYRLYWLASSRDAWTTAGLRDSTGQSGSFLGQLLDWRMRWKVLPDNLMVELGANYLIRGEFARTVGGTDRPVVFGYAALVGSI
jgi:hypothetical protein